MFLLDTISRLPFRVLYVLSDCIFFILCYVLKYRKKVISENLKRSFPGKNEAERKAILQSFYHHLADIIVETIKALTISPDELIRRVHIINAEELTNHLKVGQSVIVMASHQANWEWLQLVHAAKLNYAVDAVYKPLHNNFSEKLMLTIRTRFGSYPLPMFKLPREIVSRKEITRIIAMVADQTPAPEQAIWLNFLHQDTPFFTGAAKIAKRTGYPVLFAGMRRVKRGRYEVYFSKITGTPNLEMSNEEIIQKYTLEVEKAIIARPAEWLWSHKRWKHKRQVQVQE
ncbi:lysophospholipid acyltransferase family protein [Rhodocytophaga rosea]|uniref:Lysophospholipid acyltransferase family protein n=1 Tax=Rhodocytophaga rosea TaxID=2704465 RepID=A0A6C0GU61_9BACT|nr:lysophospholipid acyltransferase family protein [Rhodocytophaga rosea]QHT71457.1 lysophospholipid acyltransferase family protein [Rhodocytophaga rosea]